MEEHQSSIQDDKSRTESGCDDIVQVDATVPCNTERFNESPDLEINTEISLDDEICKGKIDDETLTLNDDNVEQEAKETMDEMKVRYQEVETTMDGDSKVEDFEKLDMLVGAHKIEEEEDDVDNLNLEYCWVLICGLGFLYTQGGEYIIILYTLTYIQLIRIKWKAFLHH